MPVGLLTGKGKEGPTETVAYSIALPLYAFGRPASILAF